MKRTEKKSTWVLPDFSDQWSKVWKWSEKKNIILLVLNHIAPDWTSIGYVFKVTKRRKNISGYICNIRTCDLNFKRAREAAKMNLTLDFCIGNIILGWVSHALYEKEMLCRDTFIPMEIDFFSFYCFQYWYCC